MQRRELRDIRLDWATSSAYAQHLAAINEEKLIRAATDIYDTDGKLLLRKGSPIDYEAARKLLKHKLTRPLDSDIELDSVVSASGLVKRFNELVLRIPDVRTAHNNFQFQKEFEKIANRFKLPSLVAQKLTVMSIRQPVTMEQTLLGAWLSLLVGRQLKLDERELSILYLAAICRDMGMLHVDPTLLDGSRTGVYGPDEWKALQSHAVVSRMILEECEGLPERMLDAVSQHHENVDGTGYPSNLKDSELGILGQILSVADTVIALRVRKFRGSGRNLRDAQIVLQIEVDTYREEVVKAATKVLGQSGIQRTTFHSYENRQALANGLYDGAQSLLKCAEILQETIDLLEADDSRRFSASIIQAYAKRLHHTLARSGLADGAVVSWLEELKERVHDVALVDLTEIDLQQRELLWQFKRLYVNILSVAQRENFPPQSALGQVLKRMDIFLGKAELTQST